MHASILLRTRCSDPRKKNSSSVMFNGFTKHIDRGAQPTHCWWTFVALRYIKPGIEIRHTINIYCATTSPTDPTRIDLKRYRNGGKRHHRRDITFATHHRRPRWCRPSPSPTPATPPPTSILRSTLPQKLDDMGSTPSLPISSYLEFLIGLQIQELEIFSSV